MKQRLRTLFCCALLEFAALAGGPMRPEEIRDLMQAMNAPKMAQTDPERETDGDKPEAGEPGAI
jgi:hypothetical protein